MTKGTNQKLKMLYLKQIFEEETDDQHSLTLQNITERLNSLGVNADRKTLYQDFKELKRYGMDIIAMQEGRTWNYHLGSRDFELPEVKLLVDSVQASKFINEYKSDTLIRKLEKLVSHYEGQELQRQVYIFGRIKTSDWAEMPTAASICRSTHSIILECMTGMWKMSPLNSKMI